MMDKDGFLRDLLRSYYAHDCMDIDGGDVHELLVKYGFIVERPATEEDCKQPYAVEYGVEPGDNWAANTPKMTIFMGA